MLLADSGSQRVKSQARRRARSYWEGVNMNGKLKRFAAPTVLVACMLAGALCLVAAQSSRATATTPIDTLFHDGFESGDFSNWTSNNGLVTHQSLVFRGSWAAEATATGSTAAFAEKDVTSQTSIYYETWFNIVSQSTNVNLLRFRNDLLAHNALATLFVSSTGKLGFRNDVTAVQTTSALPEGVVSTGTWHTAQVHVTINGTSSSTEVW